MRTTAQTKEYGKMIMGMYSLMKNDVYLLHFNNYLSVNEILDNDISIKHKKANGISVDDISTIPLVIL